jgi:crotonobetainyl-CoA:carnitine CoA-transferase CaiB-like acyl-CoA transferase
MPIPRQAFEPDRQGPLRGVRVVDFSRLVASNMLSLQLADFGAEVVKVVIRTRAQVILARARAVEETARRKTEALRRNAR